MRLNVAYELGVCVKSIGGVVLDEALKQPRFANADYWFPTFNVVAELKCLTENLGTKADFNANVQQMYESWVRKGLISPPQFSGPLTLNLADLPQKCAREFLEPIKRRLEASAIKKANRQIRETKQFLNATDAKGLLILVNDGNHMLPPSVMANLLARMLVGQYSSINSVIYFSVNESVRIPRYGTDGLFWVDGLIAGRSPVAVELRQNLQTTWMAHHSSFVEGYVFELDGRATDLDGMQFHRT